MAGRLVRIMDDNERHHGYRNQYSHMLRLVGRDPKRAFLSAFEKCTKIARSAPIKERMSTVHLDCEPARVDGESIPDFNLAFTRGYLWFKK
jgi:hypothetical protein